MAPIVHRANETPDGSNALATSLSIGVQQMDGNGYHGRFAPRNQNERTHEHWHAYLNSSSEKKDVPDPSADASDA
jgi:hypothetical protein